MAVFVCQIENLIAWWVLNWWLLPKEEEKPTWEGKTFSSVINLCKEEEQNLGIVTLLERPCVLCVTYTLR